MDYILENDFLKVTVRSMGAELVSMVGKDDGTEYLWQGDPTFWPGHAYNLFPICGRLTQGKYTYQGNTYEMILHGFARNTEMKLVSQTPDSLTFRLEADDVSLAQYPFRFILDVTYRLAGRTVTTAFAVKNADDKVMYFALGGHPGFNVPLCQGECFTDYYLEFDCVKSPRKLHMSDTCYLLETTEPFPLEDGIRLSLDHSLFDNDAIFLTNMCKAVTLRSRKCNKSVRVTYPEMNYLGLWHKPRTEAPYVCIEPWYSIPAYHNVVDDLETKRDMIALEPGKVYTNSFAITLA